jgi:hypothetical protein
MNSASPNPDGCDKAGSSDQVAVWQDGRETAVVGEHRDGLTRGGVVVLDGTAGAVA